MSSLPRSSCWTENPEENIPLWRMYSGNAHGVRIALDADMFEDNVVGGNNVLPQIPHEGFLVGKIPAQDLFRKEYFVMPLGNLGVTDWAKWLVANGVGKGSDKD